MLYMPTCVAGSSSYLVEWTCVEILLYCLYSTKSFVQGKIINSKILKTSTSMMDLGVLYAIAFT